MGLSAVVFKNKLSMEKEFGENIFSVEPETGEAELLPNVNIKIPFDSYVANQQHFGNISQIDFLRVKVEKEIPETESIIKRMILYSGAHSGDFIRNDYFDQLKGEIEVLKHSPVEDVKEFSFKLESLVASACEEGNPIVFV